MRKPTKAQRALDALLHDPVDAPALDKDQLILTLTLQRDSALQELNDRANLEVAVQRFDECVRRIQQIAKALLRIKPLLKARRRRQG